MKRKEIAALILIGALLSGLITAGASEAGTSGNPLISLEWLKETFLPGLEKDLDEKVNNGMEDLVGGFVNSGPEGHELRVKRGDVIMLERGSVLTSLAGEISIVSSDGTVLDVTYGSPLPDRRGNTSSFFCYLRYRRDPPQWTLSDCRQSGNRL